jgi:threonine synthase
MKTFITSTLFSTLVCSKCGTRYSGSSVNTYATCCNKPLLASYDFGSYSFEEIVDSTENSMWRYSSLLPVSDKKNIVSLHEGMTPILPLNKLSANYNCSVLLKDESYNPTGSFKARGLSVAVSRARELGIDRLIIPTAGNAGGALAAYCAKANMKCIVVMPEHTPSVFKQECKLYGAELILVKGLINDCAKKVEEIRKSKNYFDVSTLKEPYRLEGKKTMGYEIAEQLDRQLPDVIVYPAGGGTGLIGIWKAFNEMLKLGWIKQPLPRMIAVQPENCAPLATAMTHPTSWKEHFTPHASIANGLAVPYPFGMELMLEVIYSSNGDVVTVSEKEIIEGIKEVARTEGLLLSPEGSAAWKGIEHLLRNEKIMEDERVLFLNTGSGYKYMESLKEFL